jgi:hypothetical protein
MRGLPIMEDRGNTEAFPMNRAAEKISNRSADAE